MALQKHWFLFCNKNIFTVDDLPPENFLLFCLTANLNSSFPSCSTGKTFEIVHLPRGRSRGPGYSFFFFPVRFVKIIPIMILLATGWMWLLKKDLWKNSYPQKTPAGGRSRRGYSLCKFNSRGYICVPQANKSESHNPRPQVPLHVPSRLLSRNFETAEAELIWRGINLAKHLQAHTDPPRPHPSVVSRGIWKT